MSNPCCYLVKKQNVFMLCLWLSQTSTRYNMRTFKLILVSSMYIRLHYKRPVKSINIFFKKNNMYCSHIIQLKYYFLLKCFISNINNACQTLSFHLENKDRGKKRRKLWLNEKKTMFQNFISDEGQNEVVLSEIGVYSQVYKQLLFSMRHQNSSQPNF